ncbi:hypothetical protein MRX96_027327 [Rhipicephalus microplus]
MERRKPAYEMTSRVPRCVGLDANRLRERLNFSAKKGGLLQVHYMRNVVVLYFTAERNPQCHEVFSRNKITSINVHDGAENMYADIRAEAIARMRDSE